MNKIKKQFVYIEIMDASFDENKNICFFTNSLVHKWGFEDGHLLEDFLRQNGYDRWDEDSDDWYDFSRDVLCEVVECLVCTKIENKIKPYRMGTSHNPIRVYEVDGQDQSDWEQMPTLKPSFVDVSKKDILEIAAKLYQERLAISGEVRDYIYRSKRAIAVAQEYGW